MKQNKLFIKIKNPISEVFEFTTNPKNTSKWIEDILVEESSEWPIKIGTIYRNKNQESEWSEYRVVAFESDKLFELVSKDKNYHVRYTYRQIDDNLTELEYFEWVDKGEIQDPFTKDILERLKEIAEK